MAEGLNSVRKHFTCLVYYILAFYFKNSSFEDELIVHVICIILQWISSRVDRSTAVHKTEVIKSNLNPTWKPFTVPVRALCNGHLSR